MASQTIASAGLLTMFLVWASVIGAVERRERFVFAAGVLAIVASVWIASEPAGAVVAVVGFVLIVASTVPLLR